MSKAMERKWFEFETKEDLERYIIDRYEREKSNLLSGSRNYALSAKLSHIGELAYLSGKISEIIEKAMVKNHMTSDWVNQGAKKVRIPTDIYNYMIEDIKHRGNYDGVNQIPGFFRLYVVWEHLEGILKDFSRTTSSIDIFDTMLNESKRGLNLKDSFWHGLEELRLNLRVGNDKECDKMEFSAICAHVKYSKLAGERYIRNDVDFKRFMENMSLFFGRESPQYRESNLNGYLEKRMDNKRKYALLQIFPK